MAERVDIRRESKARQAIISILRTHKILNEQQIRAVVLNWEHYDYKISGVTRKLTDYCECIKYQETLLQLINKKTIKPSVKELLVRFLVNDIKKLMQTCMDTPAYRGEFDMFMLKLSFCRLTDDFTVGTETVDNLIKAHPSNPKVWHEAAKWFISIHKPNQAISILHKGLEVLGEPVNTEVYFVLISLEIDIAVGMRSRKVLSQKQLDTRREKLLLKLDVYITDFESRNYKDSSFLFIILDKFYELKIEHSLIERVKKLIEEKFYHLSQTWELLVQRDLIDAEKSTLSPAFIIDRYKTGLLKLIAFPDEYSLLWKAYLDFLLDVNARQILFPYAQANKYLVDAFKEAADCDILEEQYYLDWFDFTTDDEFENILNRSLIKYPHSSELWNVKVNCELMRYGNDQERILEIFDRATEACGERGVELWNSMLRHTYVMWDADQVEAIFRKGLDIDKQSVVVVNELKPRFIEWLAIARDSDVAIREYHELCEKEPFCKRLHDIALNIRSFNMNQQIVTKAYRLLRKQFSKDSDVYVRSVRYQFLLNTNEAIMPRKAAIQSIYQEAQTHLDDMEFNIFLKQFNDMKCQEMVCNTNIVNGGRNA